MMNKKICSIIIVILTLLTACKQSVKQDNVAKNTGVSKTGIELANASSLGRLSDLSFHDHAKGVSKKLSCCIGPPSRIKIKAGKK